MRIPTGKIPDQPLTFLWERHREIARRAVAGEKPIEIARTLGFTPSRLSIIMNSPAFQNYLSILSKEADKNATDVQARLQDLCVDSMSILEDAIRKKNEAIRPMDQVKVAQDVLDRGGYSAVQKTVSATLSLTPEDIESLKKRRDALRESVVATQACALV